jgi:D-alanyl-D-alanine carboxypeptidase
MRVLVLRWRLASHALVLAAVTALVFGSAFAAPARVTQVPDTDATADPAAADPGSLSFVAIVPTPGLQTQAMDGRHALAFDPRAGLPQWVRSTHDVSLWSGADAGARLLGSLPSRTTYFKPLGPFGDDRVQVYFPGDDAHPAAQAWVDLEDVEASGLPPWAATDQSVWTALPSPPKRLGDTPAPYVSALHVAIIDEASGRLMYSEDPYARVPQASTTKIATTIVALERSPDLNRRIRITVSAMAMANRDGSSTMGIEPGRSVSLDTLLHGMMLPSGNDAAEQVAVALADSREEYVGWMNQAAEALGLKDTHFVNPSGMDADGHYSSAYDMAMLARYAMRNPAFRDLAGSSRYVGDNFSMQNLNRFLDLYPGADGVKIGFTDAAQKTIVASATRDGHRVYVSLMHSQDLVGDCSALFDWVWNSFSWS